MYDSTIRDNIGVKFVGENEIALTGSITQNNIPVLEENYIRRMNANNGFSNKRMFRHIASIPLVAWIEATARGYNLDDEHDLKRFLAENDKDYLTVNAMDTGASGRIIVK